MIESWNVENIALISLGFFAFSIVAAFVFMRHSKILRWVTGLSTALGSTVGILFSGKILLTKETFQWAAQTFFVHVNFAVDDLSAWFIFAISLLGLATALYGISYTHHFEGKYSVPLLSILLNLFIISMIFVVSAANILLFLMMWEIMSLVSAGLVFYEYRKKENIRAGIVYFVMTHVGTAFLTFALILLGITAGSFDFSEIAGSVSQFPDGRLQTIFIFAFIGLATKAGVIPFHIWLPKAHPAAPSHISALMSGVMIKTAIYMMIRLFLDFFPPSPLWWGVLILLAGAISSLLGVLYALAEHDIKRLLAYHSVENIGIILMGLGSAMIFTTKESPVLAAMGLAAALFHTLNHALFKGLLFLGAGSVVLQTGTKNMERYGGLIKLMPLTAVFFLIGAAAISALPPLNGFASERLTFHALFDGLLQESLGLKTVFIVAISSLAFTGGLAAACFVKAFGITFLARPREVFKNPVHEVSWLMQAGMGILASLCIVLGLSAPVVVRRLIEIARNLLGSSLPASAIRPNDAFLSAYEFNELFVVLIFLGIMVALGVWAISRHQRIVRSRIWDCGEEVSPRNEITATSFSRALITIFQGILKPTQQTSVEYHDATSRYFVKSRTVLLETPDVYHRYFYDPITNWSQRLSDRVKHIQVGNVHVYLLYIFLTLIFLLIWTVKFS